MRREGDSPAQRQVEVVLAVDDAADYGPVRGVLTPHQLDAVGVVLGDEPALHGLGGPGEHDSRTHAVEAQGFDCMSAGVVLAWATEAMERGLITENDTDGVQLVWGEDAPYRACLLYTS